MDRIVHISDVMNYKACRRKWAWSSSLKGNLEPKIPYEPFFVGRAVHACIEDLISDGAAVPGALSKFLRPELASRKNGVMWKDEVPAIRNQVRLIRALMEQYLAWSRHNTGPFSDRNLDYIAHEVRFDEHADADWAAVPLQIDGKILEPIVYVAGRFDGLARTKIDGRVWLIEHKTCRGIEERVKLLQHDEQATTYSYAAQELFGEPVAGVIYTLLRKKEAEIPRPVRGGGLSQDKRIDTSPEVYRAAITAHHGARSEQWIQQNYGEVLGYIKDFREPFVARIAIQRSQAQIRNYVRELHATALEMYNPDTYMTATRTWSCPGCLFRGPCLAVDVGEDDRANLLLQTTYQQRSTIELTEKDGNPFRT